MTKSRLGAYGADGICRLESTKRTNWMENNAIPDSIITNMICRSVLPPVEPKVRSTEVLAALTSKNTLRILNTINPVTRALTTMDKEKLVIANGISHAALEKDRPCTCTSVVAPVAARQVARGDKYCNRVMIK